MLIRRTLTLYLAIVVDFKIIADKFYVARIFSLPITRHIDTAASRVSQQRTVCSHLLTSPFLQHRVSPPLVNIVMGLLLHSLF